MKFRRATIEGTGEMIMLYKSTMDTIPFDITFESLLISDLKNDLGWEITSRRLVEEE